MTARERSVSVPPLAAPRHPLRLGLARWRRATATERREWRFAFVLLLPAILMIGIFVAYPFVRGIWLSLTDTVVGREGQFVGLHNFTKLWHDGIFRRCSPSPSLGFRCRRFGTNFFRYTRSAASWGASYPGNCALRTLFWAGWLRVSRRAPART